MVEPILYASLGALLATLAGLLFLPFFWSRAVRLTTRRLIDRLPVSADEIVAAQDRLRAELAMSMRETERKAERVAAEATRDRVESARARATELGHLADISDLRSQISFLEAEGVKVRGERDKTSEQAANAFSALEEARAAATQAAKDLQAARQDASASRAATEQARIEAAERETEIAALKAKLAMLGMSRPAVGGKPTMPHIDRPFGDTEMPSADVAALAILRQRLDEVADLIVKAADTPAAQPAGQPTQSESAPKVQPKPEARLFFPKLATPTGADA
jgi:hypothetical protein